jgi:hypothetical protein
MSGRVFAVLWVGGICAAGGCAKAQQYQRWLSMSAPELRAQISTPEEAAELLDLILNPGADEKRPAADDWRSLGYLLRHHRGDCDDYAVGSAALLSDDGYADKVLVVGYVRWFVDSQDELRWRGYCHAVHLLEKDGLYGANGQIHWDRIPPRYASIEELVRKLPLNEGRWEFYKVISLREVDYVDAEANLFEQLANTWKQTAWIDVEYPEATSRPQEPAPQQEPFTVGG